MPITYAMGTDLSNIQNPLQRFYRNEKTKGDVKKGVNDSCYLITYQIHISLYSQIIIKHYNVERQLLGMKLEEKVKMIAIKA